MLGIRFGLGIGRIRGPQQEESAPAIGLVASAQLTVVDIEVAVNVTIPTGHNNRLAVAMVQVASSGDYSVGTPTYGGVPMTLVEQRDLSAHRLYVFYLVNPAEGTQACYVEFLDEILEPVSASGGMMVAVFENVDQDTPIIQEVVATGSSNAPSATATLTNSGNVLVSFMVAQNGNYDVTGTATNGTSQQSGSGSNRSRHGWAYRDSSGAIAWTLSRSCDWVNVLEEIKQAS